MENTQENKKEETNNDNIFDLPDSRSKSVVFDTQNELPKRTSDLRKSRGSSFKKSFGSPDRRQSILEGVNFKNRLNEPTESILISKAEYIFYYGNQHSKNNSNLKVDIKGDFNGWKK